MRDVGAIHGRQLIISLISVSVDFSLLMKAHLRSNWYELEGIVVARIIKEVVSGLSL